MNPDQEVRAKLLDGVRMKREYHPPELTVFGQVAKLTQGASTCGANDSANCINTSTNMGPMAGGSDRRIKEDIVRIGVHPLGIGLYLFNYKAEYRETWGRGRQFGVMADEVEAVMPLAVCVHPDGYRVVDYGMLGVRRRIQ